MAVKTYKVGDKIAVQSEEGGMSLLAWVAWIEYVSYRKMIIKRPSGASIPVEPREYRYLYLVSRKQIKRPS